MRVSREGNWHLVSHRKPREVIGLYAILRYQYTVRVTLGWGDVFVKCHKPISSVLVLTSIIFFLPSYITRREGSEHRQHFDTFIANHIVV